MTTNNSTVGKKLVFIPFIVLAAVVAYFYFCQHNVKSHGADVRRGAIAADGGKRNGTTASFVQDGEGVRSHRAGERAVLGFYSAIDALVSANFVSTNDIQAFVRCYSDVPAARKKECLYRALNLVPDEKVSLLTGILFDNSQPKEIVREVFFDIVNRQDAVKKPIIAEILKDKSHPCYSDAEWIYEVTGEKPSGDGN